MFAPGHYQGRIDGRTRHYYTADGAWFAPWEGGTARPAEAFEQLIPMTLKLGRTYGAGDVAELCQNARYYEHKPTIIMGVRLPESGTVTSPRDGQDLPVNAGDYLCWDDHGVWIVEGAQFAEHYGDPPRPSPNRPPTDYESIGRP